MDFSGMSSAEQAHMNRVIERKQVRACFKRHARRLTRAQQMQDFMRMYSSLVERCFNACCNDFTSKALSSKEVRPPSSQLPFPMC